MTYSSKKLLTSLLLLTLCAFFGFSAASANLDDSLVGNTVPTRTPVPPPPEPTQPQKEEPSNPNPPSNDPAPTAVPPTATPEPVIIAPTPINGFVSPTRCGEPFFVATLGSINVRSAPTTESEILSKMVYLEARQVLGRWEGGAWWLILQPDTSSGWVYDETGSMVGVMEIVPIVDADGKPGSEPTWNPTPDLQCPTLTPTAVPTEEPTATATAEPPPTQTPRPTAAQKTVPAKNDEEDSETTAAALAVTVTIDPSAISALPQTDESPIEPAVISDRESTQKPESPSAIIGGQAEATSSSGFSWPIIVGILLVLFGIGTLVFQNRQEKS